MRVFVTGASGFVGSAVVRELLANGHQVLGLARSEAAAASIRAAGAEAHYGDLGDHDSLRKAVAVTDGIIHCGFIHDFSRFVEVCELDRLVIAAMGEALEGTPRPFVITSGIALLRTDDRLVEETDMPTTANPRRASEEAADAAAAMGVNVSVLRLPPSVHDLGDGGFVPMLFGMATAAGRSVYTGDGSNSWPAVHRRDAARLYRLALEGSATPGTRYHAVGDTGVPFREIAEVVARQAGLPLESVGPEESAAHFGNFAHFANLNVRASAEATKAALGWAPEQIGLIEDIDRPEYFQGK